MCSQKNALYVLYRETLACFCVCTEPCSIECMFFNHVKKKISRSSTSRACCRCTTTLRAKTTVFISPWCSRACSFIFVAALIQVSRSGYFVFFGWRAFSCCLPLSYNAWRCGHELRQQSQSTVYRDFDIMCQCTCGVPLPVVFLRCSLGVLCFYYRHRLSLADLLSFGFITGTLTLCASVTRALTCQELKQKCVSGKYATGLGTKGGFMNYDNTVKSLGT